MIFKVLAGCLLIGAWSCFVLWVIVLIGDWWESR